MIEEFGYEATPQQSLDGLWKTMHKYIENHGHSDISLEIEGSQYEFRKHLEKYDEYKIKAEAYDELIKLEDEWADECLDYIEQYSGSEWDKENDDDLQTIDNEWHFWRSSLRDIVYIKLKELEKKEG